MSLSSTVVLDNAYQHCNGYVDADYEYYGGQALNSPRWRILKKVIATDTYTYCFGESNYASAWDNKFSLIYQLPYPAYST